MKGGRTAPRSELPSYVFGCGMDASMKGGRTAPRSVSLGKEWLPRARASMKGGRTAPRSLRSMARIIGDRSFNEGGADCPPKHE